MSNPVSPPDLSGLSISSQLERNANESYDTHPNAPAFFSTAPPGGAPYGNNVGYGQQSQAPATFDAAHFNNTIASTGSKARGGLPSHWRDQLSSGPSMQDGRSMSPPTDVSSTGSPPPGGFLGASPQPLSSGSPGGTAQPGGEDDIIPTAIVIKNIPFSVKRETLLEIIASLSIPTPYAFNYHVDAQGAFRGLAFANFRLPQDADAVVAALNGFDVQGRKLRVEYKKVLQAGEKERIEREKALRRMRSMQMEKERQAQAVATTANGGANGDWEDYGQVQGQYGGGIGVGHPSPGGGVQQSPIRSYSNGGALTSHQMSQPNLPSVPPVPQIPQQYYQQLQRQPSGQHQAPLLHVTTPPPVPDIGSLDQFQHRSFSPPSVTSTSPPPLALRAYQQDMHPQSMVMPDNAVSPPPKNYAELDMNDPSTLEIYSRILLFKDDRMRDELAFSRSLTAMERRVVHMVAKKLGLYHRSVGEGSERYAVVMRYPPDNSRPPPPPRQPSHTLSRAQSSYLSASTGPSATASSNPTLSSSTSALRAKKSMPDLSSLHPPSSRLNTRASNGNIREGYATISGSGRRTHPGFTGLFGGPNDDGGTGGSGIPPVPTLPPNLDGASATGFSAPGGVVRQPRGPGGEGFGPRRVSDLPSRLINNTALKAPAPVSNVDNTGLDTQSHEPFEI